MAVLAPAIILKCRYPDDLQGPQAVIVVPHRELGVQITFLIYQLFEGSRKSFIGGA
jgi:hypothetical protein